MGECGNGNAQLRCRQPRRQCNLQRDLIGAQVGGPPDASRPGVAVGATVARNGLVDGLARGLEPGLAAILAVQPELGGIGHGIDHQAQPQAMGTGRGDADRRHLSPIRGLGPAQRACHVACGLQRRQRPRRPYLHGHTGHGHDRQRRVVPLRQCQIDGLGSHGHGCHGHASGRSRSLGGRHYQRIQHIGRGRTRRRTGLCDARTIAAAVTDTCAARARVRNTASAPSAAASGQHHQHQACA